MWGLARFRRRRRNRRRPEKTRNEVSNKKRLSPLLLKPKLLNRNIETFDKPQDTTRKLGPRLKIWSTQNDNRQNFNNDTFSSIRNILQLSRLIDHDREVCRRRKTRKKIILKMTHGRGLSVKKAKWTADSLINCKE
ncbi:hypothetical protein [Tortoise microvirus 100]|nr:hypothetical protein [Tortoise microvirus 100]